MPASDPTPRRRRAPLDDATRMAKALAHPLRAKVLMRLDDEGVASPNEIARELGENLGNVSYHVRALVDLDCIELVDTAPRRGAVEHYYRATRRAILEDDAWRSLPPTARRGFAVQWFKEAFKAVSAAIDAGGFEGEREHYASHVTLRLDEQGRQQLNQRLSEVAEEARRLQTESAARDGSGGETLACRLIIAHFETPDRAGPRS